MPLFVREGSIVPMLLTDVQTLCDANYVNDPNISTPDSGLKFLVYPAGASQFTVYDGTNIQCQAGGGKLTVTISSVARAVILQLLADEPAAVERDGTALARLATTAQFDAAVTGWRADAQARLVSIKFQHTGGVTKIDL
jgi:alpha-D-xyloside xylohydrolase